MVGRSHFVDAGEVYFVLCIAAAVLCATPASAATKTDLQVAIGSSEVVVFSLPGCPYCREAERALTAANIEFTKLHIGPFKQALRTHFGKSSAPAVFIRGIFVGGCNDGTLAWHGVKPMLASGRFQRMLAGDLKDL